MSTRPSTATPVEHTAWQGWYEIELERGTNVRGQDHGAQSSVSRRIE
ncbi:hypothetical protein [Glutamicibacter sp. PS]|nr:hypothetical protein [Glutamicibacter sp. PS]MDR4534276.1 hypothetical protein [Glutamicibacter sp. PS]